MLVECTKLVAAIVECKTKWMLKTTPKRGDDRAAEEYRDITCMVTVEMEATTAPPMIACVCSCTTKQRRVDADDAERRVKN